MLISFSHFDNVASGQMTRVAPHGVGRLDKSPCWNSIAECRVVRISIKVVNVFPNPMSSARIEPRQGATSTSGGCRFKGSHVSRIQLFS